jgi:histidine triad (HIT) family protein
MFDSKCVFCKIIQGLAPAHKVHEWDDAIAIVPLAPVTGERFLPGEGHVLVMPKTHVPDYAFNPEVTGRTFKRAAELADLRDSNLITSKGESATQTVHHLHVHLVPRVPRDGLPLPWTPQQAPLSKEHPFHNFSGMGLAGIASDMEATRGSLVRLLEGDAEYARVVEHDNQVGAPLSRLARCAMARFNPID